MCKIIIYNRFGDVRIEKDFETTEQARNWAYKHKLRWNSLYSWYEGDVYIVSNLK